jgi:transposase-like protein
MAQFYVVCPGCRRRMRLIGTSLETFGHPPPPVERYYRCPDCGAEWMYNVERSLQSLGVPAHVTQLGHASLQ